AAAVAAKKLQAGNSGDGGWQSSYDPAPPPSPGRGAMPPPPPPAAVTEVPEELTPVDGTSPLGSERS
uniref:hypothetical protein n=1 Tax=Nocardioides stalactiti TaxID=2755356 RepID=UPI001C816B34